MMQFKKAERRHLKLKIALIGPSGSGKSYSALRLATGMIKASGGGKIAYINTERNRGELYSSQFDYDMIDLTPPYEPERFIAAVQAAIDGGYQVVIVDSASHEWVGQGGIIDTLDKMPGENSFSKWAKLTPRHNKFIDFMRDSPIHLIACLRGKDEFALEEVNGKKVPKKIGMGAQMRDGLEYELHVSFSLQMNHVASVEGGKDNTTMFDQKYEIITEKHGEQLIQWATSGKIPEPKKDTAPAPASESPELDDFLKKVKAAETLEDLEKLKAEGAKLPVEYKKKGGAAYNRREAELKEAKS